jgi:prefoldin subunit 5
MPKRGRPPKAAPPDSGVDIFRREMSRHFIDARIDELRFQIASIETRIEELEAMKEAGDSTGGYG